MPITPLSKGAADYLRSFDLRAVCQSAGGRIWISDNPSGAVAAYWCRASDAGRVAEAAWHLGNIMAAGHRCGAPHQIVLKRTAERMAALDQEIARAIDAGTLKRFNATYRERRLAAKQCGQPFMSYSEALRKLRAVVAGSVARKEIPATFSAVFDETPAPPPGRIASERVSNH
jgi:hypothetical protein